MTRSIVHPRRRLVQAMATPALAAGVGAGAAPGARAGVSSPTRFDAPVPNGCTAADCSLREAIIDANATLGQPDTIMLLAGTYQLSILGTDEAAGGDGG